MEIINKGGQTFWVPVSDRESSSINSFAKWEHAFRVYMNIFARVHPGRVTELIQYINVIEIAASSFQWDQVYRNDREFRIHMAKHPERNWGIILQQAWSLYLRVNHSSKSSSNYQGQGEGASNHNNANHPKKICFRFNQGKCAFGFSCKFDHRYGICNKLGHGAFSCRKVELQNNKDRDYNQDRDRYDRETGKKFYCDR